MLMDRRAPQKTTLRLVGSGPCSRREGLHERNKCTFFLVRQLKVAELSFVEVG